MAKHLACQDRRSIYIAELDETIYFSKINIIEWEKIVKLSKKSLASASIYMIIEKAEDANGNKVFSAADRPLLEKIEWKIILQITNGMAKEIFPAEAKRPLSGIPLS